jgi:predicted ribosome quality control (RQC) complex YloA/Tae2 family protein
MAMNLNELKAVISEAAPLVKGRSVLDFRDAGPDRFMLILEAPEYGHPRLLRLLVSLRPGLDRIHLTPRRSPKKAKVIQTEFTARVKEALEGAELLDMELPEQDRLARIAFRTAGGVRCALVAELIGRHANLLLLDEQGTILQLVKEFKGKNRCLLRDGAYAPLPLPTVKTRSQPRPRFEVRPDSSWKDAPLNGAADDYFLRMEKRLEHEQLEGRVRDIIARRLAKEERKLVRLEEERRSSEEAERFRKLGDLLQANFHRLNKGDGEIEIEDLFEPEAEKIVIPLDPALDPAENIARYYRRYKKLKNGMEHLARLCLEAKEEIDRLKNLEATLRETDSMNDLREAAVELGLAAQEPKPARKAGRHQPGPEVRKFRTSDGLLLLVGKDGASNDELTFRTARGNDMWLHCREAAGSHVIVRPAGRKPVPLSSLLDAGLMAKHYSKRRDADKAEVIYTQRKYVRKIRGAAPGRVQVERFKTLHIERDPERLKKILETSEGGEASRA